MYPWKSARSASSGPHFARGLQGFWCPKKDISISTLKRYPYLAGLHFEGIYIGISKVLLMCVSMLGPIYWFQVSGLYMGLGFRALCGFHNFLVRCSGTFKFCLAYRFSVWGLGFRVWGLGFRV